MQLQVLVWCLFSGGSGTGVAAEPEDPFRELPWLHRQTYIASVSGPMHWFSVDFMEVERSGCRVGVPVTGGPVVKHCYYPAPVGGNERPKEREIRLAWRRARSAVRGSQVRDLHVRYVGTWNEVNVTDLVPQYADDNPNVDRLYDIGHATYAVTEQGIARAPVLGLVSGGGRGLPPRLSEPPHFVEPEGPVVMDGASLLRQLWRHDPSPAVRQAEQRLMAAVMHELPAWEAGERRGPSLTKHEAVPASAAQALVWHVDLYARPALSDDGFLLTQQQSASVRLQVPVGVARTHVVRWSQTVPLWGVQMTFELDLTVGEAALAVRGPHGDQAHAAWTVSADLRDDAGRLWARSVRAEMVEKTDRIVHQAVPLRNDQMQLGAPAGFRVLDIYVHGVELDHDPWNGEVTWTMVD